MRARHAAASESAAKNPIGFGFQMNVDSSIAAGETARSAPAIRPATGPPIDRPSHHVSATAAIPSRARKAVTATGSPFDSPADGREQEVVERAMVELPDGRLRPEQRHDPVAGERDEGEHVVALVGVESPP